MLELSIKTI